MGFWSKLGKGLAIGGAGLGTALSFGAGAPVLGATLGAAGGLGGKISGALSSAGGALSGVGRAASGGAGAMEDTRLAEANLANTRDRNALQMAAEQIQQNTSRDQQGLDRAKFGLDAPLTQTKQAAYGDALANVQDVNIDFQPKSGSLPQMGVTGGIRPSMFGPTSRAAGADLARTALANKLAGNTGLPEMSAPVGMPTLSPPTQAGALEKTLGGVGLGGSILGALGEELKKRQRPPVNVEGTTVYNPVPGGYNLPGMRV